MHHGQNRGKQKPKLGKKTKFNENRGKVRNFHEKGKIYEFCGNRGNMHHRFRGMDSPGAGPSKLSE